MRADGGGGGSDGPHINLLSDAPSKSPDEIEADQAKEKAYKESLKKIPDAKVSQRSLGHRAQRCAEGSAPAKTTAAKAKTKTGSTPTSAARPYAGDRSGRLCSGSRATKRGVARIMRNKSERDDA